MADLPEYDYNEESTKNTSEKKIKITEQNEDDLLKMLNA